MFLVQTTTVFFFCELESICSLAPLVQAATPGFISKHHRMLKTTIFSPEDRNLIIKHLHLSFTKFLYATVFSLLPLGTGNICFFTAVSHQTFAEVKEPPINTVLCKSSTCTPSTGTASGCSYTFRDFGTAGSWPDVDSIWRWIFFPFGLKEKENTR